jgi:hypothetical protein
MTDPDQLAADVLVAETVSPEQEQAVAETLRSLGIAARTRVVPTRRGIEEVPWLVLATLPLQAFLTALASRLAEDAYQRLKELVGRVLHGQAERTGQRQVLVLQDAATRLQIVLEAGLPSAAYQQLVELDLSTIKQGPVHYDSRRGVWRSELDEATRG